MGGLCKCLETGKSRYLKRLHDEDKYLIRSSLFFHKRLATFNRHALISHPAAWCGGGKARAEMSKDRFDEVLAELNNVVGGVFGYAGLMAKKHRPDLVKLIEKNVTGIWK